MPNFTKGEATTKLKANLSARVSAISIWPDNITSLFGATVNHLKSMQPAQAVLDIADYAGEGTIKFLRRQAEITRTWFPSR